MKKSQFFKPWNFVLPGLIMGAMILGFPIYQSFVNSLYYIKLYRLGRELFVGLQNYVTLWEDPLFIMSIRVTLIFTLGCTILSIVLGLLIATVLSSKGIRGTSLARFFMAFYLIPFVTTQVVVGMLGRLFIWEPEYGLLNYLLGLVGISGPGWLISTHTAMSALIITNAWRLTPLVLLVLYAALTTIPDELIESAEVEGATGFTLLTRIKLPIIKYHVIFMALIIITSAFREFDVIYTMTGGGPGRSTNVLSMLVYHRGVSAADMGIANAISFSMFIIIAIVTVIYMKIFRLSEMGTENE